MNLLNVNPAYTFLYPIIKNLIVNFESISSVIQQSRHDIRTSEVDNKKIVLKSFKGMYFVNRLMYSAFRKSKAARSFDYSNLLTSKGIHVPPPIAYSDEFEFGILKKSVFICEYVGRTRLSDLLHKESDQEDLVKALVRYTLFLHLSGVYHHDLSPGNILVEKIGNEYKFTLLDLNRIRFKRVSYFAGIRNFLTLSHDEALRKQMAAEYAKLVGESPTEAESLIAKFANQRSRWYKFKGFLKYITFLNRT